MQNKHFRKIGKEKLGGNMTDEEFFLLNINIAYKIANNYRINYGYEIEDVKQIALLGLWKAVLTYNGKNAFSTYAFRVVQNEINNYLRKKRKREGKNISLSKEIGEKITIEDTIKDPVDYMEKVEDNIEYEKIIKIRREILSNAEEKQRKTYKYLQLGKTQQEVSKLVKASQAYVSRTRKRIDGKIAKEYWK